MRADIAAARRYAGLSNAAAVSVGEADRQEPWRPRPGRLREKTTTSSASRDRLRDAVRHEQHGRAVRATGRAARVEPLASQRIERAERLVEQQDRRLESERARDCDALAHATDNWCGYASAKPAMPTSTSSVRARSRRSSRSTPTSSSGNATLSITRLHGSRGSSEDEPHPPIGLGHRLAVDSDEAGVRLKQAGD